jgi:bifunctional UDP-N-acetylglucosamine pyrophosphorylase/glucosamine-1-phosphate N-acetyltransferase
MRSRRIKLLHDVAGRPMLSWVLDAVRGVPAARRYIVLGNQAEQVAPLLEGTPFETLYQREQRGTGHAVMQAERALAAARGDLLILSGDIPAIRASTLKGFVTAHARSGSVASVLATTLETPTGYGRILRDGLGEFAGIVEERDATAEERRIREVSVGIYCIDVPLLFRALRRTRPDNAQGEFYLPDVLSILKADGRKVAAITHDEPWEVLGVNSRAELARVGRLIYARILEGWMERGVTVLDPETTFVGSRVRIGRDTVIYPGVHLEGKSVLGEDCVVHPGCFLTDVRVEDGATILSSCVATDSRIGARAKVGPFAHLRPGTVLGPDVHVGNFVETKKARLGAGTKANHLSYRGDAEIGPACNIGAGTITCNYDGVAKHKTVLEGGVFVGSDSQLVAPVRVRRGAYIGSGSTIVKEVPAGALAISRARQTNIEGWVARKARERQRQAAQAPSARRGRTAARRSR